MINLTLRKSDKTEIVKTISMEYKKKLTRFQIYFETELAGKYKTHFTKHNIQKLLSNTKKVST